MDPRPADPNIGQLVDDRYEVVRRVARGGMATVYEGRDRRLERRIAIKLMHPHLAESADFVARFRREARAAARLSHPNVVAIHDQGTWHGTGYLVMEHVDGPNLRHELRRLGSLPVGESLEVIDQVLGALGAAHRAGLVHRDIKPENALLEPGTPGRYVKVTDFGLARAVTEATAATTGTVLGTVAYLAPEIVTDGVADPRADVYATGILLFELITGHTPVEGDTPIQIAYQHVHGRVPVPSTSVPWLPAEVDELCSALTAREPLERPQDADAARELVRRCRDALDPITLARKADVPGAPAAPPPPPATPADRADGADSADSAGRAAGGSSAGAPGRPAGADDAAARDAVSTRAPRTDTTGEHPEPDDAAGEHETAQVAGARTAVLRVGTLAGSTAARRDPGAPPAGSAGVRAVDGAPAVPAPARTAGDHDSEDPGLGTLSLPIGAIREPGEVAAEQKATRRRRRRRILWAVLAVLLVAAGGVAAWFTLGPGAYTAVPDVVDRPRAEAEQILADAGLDAAVTTDHHDEIAAEHVITTDPEPAGRVRKGGTVQVSVSLGVLMVDVPEVAGRTGDDARAALEAAGLSDITATEEHHDTVPAGQAISVSPAPGETVDHRTPITLLVSQGPAPVDTPDVRGVAESDAAATLDDAGLRMEVTGSENDDTVPEGAVLRQDPAPGTGLHRGDTVRVVLSEGPVMVEVPDVASRQVGEARQVLEDAGFTVDINEVLGGFFGTVRLQEPSAGTLAPRGSTIRLTVV